MNRRDLFRNITAAVVGVGLLSFQKILKAAGFSSREGLTNPVLGLGKTKKLWRSQARDPNVRKFVEDQAKLGNPLTLQVYEFPPIRMKDFEETARKISRRSVDYFYDPHGMILWDSKNVKKFSPPESPR